MHTGYLVISYWHLSARIFCSVNFSPTWRLSCSFIQKHHCRVMDLCTAAPVLRLRLSCSFVDQFPYAISFNRKTVKQRLPCLKLIVIFLIVWSVSHWALPPSGSTSQHVIRIIHISLKTECPQGFMLRYWDSAHRKGKSVVKTNANGISVRLLAPSEWWWVGCVGNCAV